MNEANYITISSLKSGLSREQMEKIGNAMIYISNNVRSVSKTKMLKLLFIIEEESVKKYGIPVFGIDFLMWRLGPVVKEVFIDLSDDEQPPMFKEYIKVKDTENGRFIEANNSFNDGEFSDNDICVIDSVVKEFGNMTADMLIEYTHREGSLWYQTAKENNMLEDFNSRKRNDSDVVITFERVAKSVGLDSKYLDYLEYNEAINHLK